jgi:hypothetical protein
MESFSYPMSKHGELGCSKPRLIKSRKKLAELGLLTVRHSGGKFSAAYATQQGFKNPRGDASVYYLAR